METKTFLQWKQDNKEYIESLDLQSIVTTCDTCEGDGKHECECGHLHSCRACHGTGKKDGVTDPVYELYQEYLERDQRNASLWCKEPIR